MGKAKENDKAKQEMFFFLPLFLSRAMIKTNLLSDEDDDGGLNYLRWVVLFQGLTSENHWKRLSMHLMAIN